MSINSMGLLPSIYEANSTMLDLQEIISVDINNLASSFDETIDECFVNTASSLLSRYEQIYGLNVDVSKSRDFRRERIRAKIIGIGTVTKQMIVDTAASYSNGEVEVIEDSTKSSFTVKFVGTLGIPANMADLKITIEEIKPAHLDFTFEYVYNTNSDLSAFTHLQLSTYTHEQLRNEVIS